MSLCFTVYYIICLILFSLNVNFNILDIFFFLSGHFYPSFFHIRHQIFRSDLFSRILEIYFCHCSCFLCGSSSGCRLLNFFLYFSLCLSIFDLKQKSYPLLIWIVGTVPLLFMGNYYITFALGIILAILSYMKHLNIGEGDFLYLASASLIFPFSKILLTIELACLLGLAYFLIRRNLKECIAFVPFLFLGIVLLTFYSIV